MSQFTYYEKIYQAFQHFKVFLSKIVHGISSTKNLLNLNLGFMKKVRRDTHWTLYFIFRLYPKIITTPKIQRK